MTSAPALPAADDSKAKRNIALLFLAQALLGAQTSALIIMGGLAGALLASDKFFATLPTSMQMLAAMLSAGPISLLMGRFGRRPIFLMGTMFGALGGALSAIALMKGMFWLLCAGHMMSGVYMAGQGFYRFAAMDGASDALKPKAASWVMTGGLAAALIGPEIVRQFNESLAPTPFAGAYAALIGLNLIGTLPLAFLDIPTPKKPAPGEGGRSLSEIFSRPAALTALITAMVSYAMMNFVMTATPLAMKGCGFSTGQAADVVRWHVIAMFGPGFFTGSLITRFGHAPIIGLGLAMIGGCAAVALSGTSLTEFYIALVLLGLGWNFGYVGATSLIATQYRPEERARVQGFNDVAILSTVAAASFASGATLQLSGWHAVNLIVWPFVALGGMMLIWMKLNPPREA